jgi:filamentous hemagglutinin
VLARRRCRALVDGRQVTIVVEAVTLIEGKATAIEARHVEDWSTSPDNPDSPVGSTPAAVEERRKMIDQIKAYAAGLEGGVVCHTNSRELATYYARSLLMMNVRNFRFVITPAIRG